MSRLIATGASYPTRPLLIILRIVDHGYPAYPWHRIESLHEDAHDLEYDVLTPCPRVIVGYIRPMILMSFSYVGLGITSGTFSG